MCLCHIQTESFGIKFSSIWFCIVKFVANLFATLMVKTYFVIRKNYILKA